MPEEPSDDAAPHAEEPRWRFDETNPPEVWTRKMVGRLTIGQIEQMTDPANGLLSGASQASFDAAHRELNEELAAKLKPALDNVLPKAMSPPWPRR